MTKQVSYINFMFDTPENCLECPMFFTDSVFNDHCGAFDFMQVKERESHSGHRPDWCPLEIMEMEVDDEK